MLAHSLPFDPADPAKSLALVPREAGVFALFGAASQAEPYLSRTPNLQRRLQRFLGQPGGPSRRLQLAQKIARIEYTVTGSDFEALLLLYKTSSIAFGDRAGGRLHLRAPSLLRFSRKNAYPRVYVTNKITISALDELFGPFASRSSAEKFLDEMLNLFSLRRCHEELHPDPSFPGCVYSEMKMCLAPCFKGCTDARYAEEAEAVYAFLETRGESLLEKIAAERTAASEMLEFERAAHAHERLKKVGETINLASPAMHELAKLSGVIVQPAADPEQVTLFLLSHGCLTGPVVYSTTGMRHPNEQSGSSSLFAHPAAVEAVALGAVAETVSRDVLQQRVKDAFAELRRDPDSAGRRPSELSEHLGLFSRWFHRPPAHRTGEVVFHEEDEAVYYRKIIRCISRVYSAQKRSATPLEPQGEALS